MASLNYQGQQIKLNRKGFLENYENWNDGLCEAFASSEGLELDEPRWRVIRFARAFYKTMGVSPSRHVLVGEIGDKLDRFRCTRHNIALLFPGGGCRQVCRLAGLPEYFNHAC